MKREWARVEVVTGMTGAGKSSYIRARLGATRPHRLMIVDPMDELREAMPGDTLRIGPDDDGIDLLGRELPPDRAWSILVVPPADAEREWSDAAARAAYDCGSCTLVIDEAHHAIPSSMGKRMTAALDVARRGRHRDVELIAASQRPAELSPTVRGLADVVAFRSREPRDLDWLRQGALPDDEILRLPDLAFVASRKEGIERGSLSFEGRRVRISGQLTPWGT